MFKSFIAAAVLLFSFTALAAPVVTLTAPVSGSCYLLASVTAASYAFNWMNVAQAAIRSRPGQPLT